MAFDLDEVNVLDDDEVLSEISAHSSSQQLSDVHRHNHHNHPDDSGKHRHGAGYNDAMKFVLRGADDAFDGPRGFRSAKPGEQLTIIEQLKRKHQQKAEDAYYKKAEEKRREAARIKRIALGEIDEDDEDGDDDDNSKMKGDGETAKKTSKKGKQQLSTVEIDPGTMLSRLASFISRPSALNAPIPTGADDEDRLQNYFKKRPMTAMVGETTNSGGRINLEEFRGVPKFVSFHPPLYRACPTLFTVLLQN